MNNLLRLKYAHFLAFHQWCFSLSKESSTMALAGMVFETVFKKTVHQAILVCCSRRVGDSSSF